MPARPRTPTNLDTPKRVSRFGGSPEVRTPPSGRSARYGSTSDVRSRSPPASSPRGRRKSPDGSVSPRRRKSASVEVSGVSSASHTTHVRTGDSFVDELLQNMTLKHFAPGAVITTYGQPAKCMYFVGRGVVECHLAGGTTQLREGTYFGEEAIFSDHALNGTTAMAHNHVACLVLRRAAVVKTLQHFPKKRAQYDALLASTADGTEAVLEWLPLVAGVAVGYSPTIQVAVRFRPHLTADHDEVSRAAYKMDRHRMYLEHPVDETKKRQDFRFDCIFDELASHQAVFNTIGRELLGSCLQGYNTCVMLYGQSGSGKTHTATELTADVVTALFDWVQKDGRPYSWKVEVSYIEIYLEKVRDLLSDERDLHIRQEGHSIFVEGMMKIKSMDAAHLIKTMQEGQMRRTQQRCATNNTSHPGHAILTVYVTRSKPGTQDMITRLTVADLAGAGREDVTDAGFVPRPVSPGFVDPRMTAEARGHVAYRNEKLLKTQDIRRETGQREKATVSTSLNNLAIVIQHLASRSAYVPYRNSKLTQLLSDCLGGSCRTWMIATVLPFDWRDSHRTLQIATAVDTIANKPVRVQPRSRPLNINISPLGSPDMEDVDHTSGSAPSAPSTKSSTYNPAGEARNVARARIDELLDGVARGNLLCLRVENGLSLSIHPSEEATLDPPQPGAEDAQRAARFPNVAFPPAPASFDASSLVVRISDSSSIKSAVLSPAKFRSTLSEAERWVASNFEEDPATSSSPGTPKGKSTKTKLVPLPGVDRKKDPFYVAMPDVLIGAVEAHLTGGDQAGSYPVLAPNSGDQVAELVIQVSSPTSNETAVTVKRLTDLTCAARSSVFVVCDFPEGTSEPTYMETARSSEVPATNIEIDKTMLFRLTDAKENQAVRFEVWGRVDEAEMYPSVLKEQLDEATRSLQELEEKMAEAAKTEALLEQTKTEVAQAADARAAMTEEKEQLESERQRLEDKIAALEENNTELKDEVVAAEKSLSAEAEARKELEMQKDKLEGQKEVLTGDVGRLEGTLEATREELAELRGAMELLRAENVEKTKEAGSLEDRLQEALQELATEKETRHNIQMNAARERTLLYALLRKIEVTRTTMETTPPAVQVAATRTVQADVLLRQMSIGSPPRE